MIKPITKTLLLAAVMGQLSVCSSIASNGKNYNNDIEGLDGDVTAPQKRTMSEVESSDFNNNNEGPDGDVTAPNLKRAMFQSPIYNTGNE